MVSLTAILIICIIGFIFSFGAIGFLCFMLFRVKENVLADIGNRVKSRKGHGGSLQKTINELFDKDIIKNIENNPVLLDIFPDSLPVAIERQAMPHWINSLISFLAPTAASLALNQNPAENSALKSVASQAISNPNVLKGVIDFFGKMREQAKQTYEPKKVTERSTGYVKNESL